MGYETGAVKWYVGMLLSGPGFMSLYLFGDTIWNTITHFQAVVALLASRSVDELVRGLVAIYVPGPGEIVGSLIVYPLVGGAVGALLWYRVVRF